MAIFGRPVKRAKARRVHFSIQPSTKLAKQQNASDDATDALGDRSWRESSLDLREGLVTEEQTIPGELLDEIFKPKR